MILKLGMKHKGNELYKVYINHDPGMTLTYFMTRSTMHLNGEKRKNGFNVKNLLGMSKMDRKFIFYCLPMPQDHVQGLVGKYSSFLQDLR